MNNLIGCFLIGVAVGLISNDSNNWLVWVSAGVLIVAVELIAKDVAKSEIEKAKNK